MPGRLEEVSSLYQHRPMPSHTLLTVALNAGTFEQFKTDFEINPKGDRDFVQQFAVSGVKAVAAKLIDMNHGGALAIAARDRLIEYTCFVNAIGHSVEHPFLCDPDSKPVCKMLGAQIRELIAQRMQIVRSQNANPQEKIIARLEYLALIREVMFRTHPENFIPNSTQLMVAVNSICTPGNLAQQINTGEGKGITAALLASLACLENQSVDVTTADIMLSERDQAEFQDFYRYLGIETSFIKAGSPKGAYKVGGVNYSTLGHLSLYRSQAKLRGESMRKDAGGEKLAVSVILDEGDKPIFNDHTTAYNLGMNLTDVDPLVNMYAWVYPLILKFIKTEKFINPAAKIDNDISNLREYLFEKSAGPAQSAQLEDIDDDQLDRWIDSALVADQLQEGEDFLVEEAERNEHGEVFTYSYARILVDDVVSRDARWSDGVHQLLHAKLNEKYQAQILATKPAFVIEAETAYVATKKSINYVDYYKQKGRVQLVSGTMSGSQAEHGELVQKTDATILVLPPHNPSQKVNLGIEVADNIRSQCASIIKEIRYSARRRAHQPILFVTENVNVANQLAATLQHAAGRSRYTIQVITGQESFDEFERKIRRAGNQNVITVSTGVMGRGKNIKPEGQHGLLTLRTCLKRPRDRVQVDGRSARYGAPGQVKAILNWQEICRQYTELAANLRINLSRVKQKNRSQIIERIEQALDKKAQFARYHDERVSKCADVFYKQYDRWLKHIKKTKVGMNDSEWHELLHQKELFIRRLERFWKKQTLVKEWQVELSDEEQALPVEKQRSIFMNNCFKRFDVFIHDQWQATELHLRTQVAGSELPVKLDNFSPHTSIRPAVTEDSVKAKKYFHSTRLPTDVSRVYCDMYAGKTGFVKEKQLEASIIYEIRAQFPRMKKTCLDNYAFGHVAYSVYSARPFR